MDLVPGVEEPGHGSLVPPADVLEALGWQGFKCVFGPVGCADRSKGNAGRVPSCFVPAQDRRTFPAETLTHTDTLAQAVVVALA